VLLRVACVRYVCKRTEKPPTQTLDFDYQVSLSVRIDRKTHFRHRRLIERPYALTVAIIPGRPIVHNHVDPMREMNQEPF
jgi:hypothetical protein